MIRLTLRDNIAVDALHLMREYAHAAGRDGNTTHTASTELQMRGKSRTVKHWTKRPEACLPLTAMTSHANNVIRFGIVFCRVCHENIARF